MDTSMNNDNQHLVLKGKNKDIWFIRMRVPKELKPIIKKEYINQTTGSSDIKVARKKRDEILAQFNVWKENAREGKFNILYENYSKIPEEQLKIIRDNFIDELTNEYPWAGHPEQGNLPDPTKDELTELDAINVALGDEKPNQHALTLSQAMRLNWKYKNYMPTTHSNHKKSVERFNFFKGIKDIEIKNIRRRHALDFKIFLEGLNLSNGTIARHFQDLGVIWNFGRDEEELTIANPFSKMGIKVKAGRKSYLAWHIDDLRKVIETMNDVRDKLIIYLAWYTGSRLGECLSVRPEDIFKDKESNIWVVSIKPDNEEREYLSRLDESAKNENARRIVPIHDNLIPHLQKFKMEAQGWKRKNPNQYSSYFSRQKMKIKDPVNPPSTRYSFHSIRHNVSTNFQRAQVDESISARLVGHSTVGATMTYGYYSEGVELATALKEVNKLPIL